MVDRVEERFQVTVDHLAATFRPAGFHFGQCVVRTATGPESVAVFAEAGLEDRSQHLCKPACWITRSSTVGIPERTPCPVGFGDPHPTNGCGSVGSFHECVGDPRPLRPRERGKVVDGHAVDPRGTLVRFHAFPRIGEVFRVEDFLDHGSSLRGSMLPTVTALVHASPSGVFGWGVCHGVDPLLIGSVLHRVSLSGNFAVLIRTPARFLDYYDLG